MKSYITVAVLVMVAASSAYALGDKSDEKIGRMKMNDDMVKNCQMHMKDGKMMDTMPKDMMSGCQDMMKDGGMMQGGMQGNMKDMKPMESMKQKAQ
jgi:hypothetical protein